MITGSIKSEISRIPRQHRVRIEKLQIITCSGEMFNHVDEGLPMWSGDGDRAVVVDIRFSHPFEKTPAITLGVTGLDSSHDQNLRFYLNAKDATATGFKIEFSTWGDTHIARASVSWQAMGTAGTRNDLSSRKDLVSSFVSPK